VALAGRIHQLAQHSDERLDMPVQVIQNENGWPLPWYLRDMKSVGYHTAMPETLQAPVVVVDTALEAEAREKMGGNYESSLWGLRPGITLSLLVEKSLWEKFLGLPPSEPPPAPATTPAASTTVATASPADTVGTPVPVATSPIGEATPPPAAPAPPKAEVVVDEGPPPFVGPPYPVPTVETSPESRRSRRRS
jgi:hypothetical protein